MSALRDARLKRALDSAPDAQLQPDARTRKAIHSRAHAAIAPATAGSWWRRLRGPDHHRMPWTAAIATVVMATLVTVLWHDREIPGARPDAITAQAPVAAPAPQQQPQPAPAARPAPPQSGAASAPAIRARPAAKPAPEAAPRQEGSAQAPPPIAAPARERGGERPTVKDEDARALAKSAPRHAGSSPPAAEAAAPPPPATAAAPAAGRAPSAVLASPMRRSVADDATRLRIVSQGRTLDAALQDRSRLADLLGRAAGMAHSAEPLAAAPDMRVELRRQGEPAGVLELAGPQLRWTPPGGEGGGTARPDPALLQALREELERLSR